jgi:hypothetical protein
MEWDHTLRGFPLAARIRFRGEFHERDFFCRNVVALLPGGDAKLRDTYVLVSAHYDHLGVGPPVGADSIYNGVVDNTMGVAGAVEMARVLAGRPEPARRSIVFLFPTAEEEGLLGSLYYLDHPLVPVHRTVANVNVDGLAHVDTLADVVGIGAEKSSLGETLERVAARRGLEVSDVPPLARADRFTFSDQAAFAEVGVPALLVNEGLHWSHHSPDESLRPYADWGRHRYHQPSDDLSQPLDFEASREHVELLVDLVFEIANDPEPPRWDPGRPEALAQLRARAVLAACAPARLPEPRFVRIAGSDTMLLLARRWAETFMRRNPGVVVHVQGGAPARVSPPSSRTGETSPPAPGRCSRRRSKV